MKILLLNPPVWKVVGYKNPSNSGLGILYVGAALRNSGHDVTIFDLEASNLWFEETIELIDRVRPTHIGFTSLISSLKSAIDLSLMIKEKYPDIWITIGGAGASSVPEYTLKKSRCDTVVVGEAELIVEKCFTERGVIEGIPTNNLDELPLPAFDLLEPRLGGPIWPGQVPRPPNISRVKESSVMWSRGCPHKCLFCCKSSIKRGPTRTRNPANIISELEYLYNRFGINSVFVFDDELMGMSEAHNKWILEVLSEVKKWNFEGGRTTPKIYLKGLGRCSKRLVTDEIAEAFVSAGFFHLAVGCESGSDKIKEIIRKNLTNEDIFHTLPLLKKHGLSIETFWMIGMPEETETEIKETERLITKVARYSDYFQTLIFTAYPGSDLWNEGIKNGWIFPGLTKEERDEKAVDILYGSFGNKSLLNMPWLAEDRIVRWGTKLYSVYKLSREVWSLARNDFS